MNRAHRPDFDLNLFKVFDAIMETRSTSQAAAAFRLSQSAVSRALPHLLTGLAPLRTQ